MSDIGMFAWKWKIVFAIEIKFLFDDSKWPFTHFTNQDSIENIVGDGSNVTWNLISHQGSGS
jgi:hypothetical protein